jgi:hypothetical protein
VAGAGASDVGTAGARVARAGVASPGDAPARGVGESIAGASIAVGASV